MHNVKKSLRACRLKNWPMQRLRRARRENGFCWCLCCMNERLFHGLGLNIFTCLCLSNTAATSPRPLPRSTAWPALQPQPIFRRSGFPSPTGSSRLGGSASTVADTHAILVYSSWPERNWRSRRLSFRSSSFSLSKYSIRLFNKSTSNSRSAICSLTSLVRFSSLVMPSNIIFYSF